MFAHSASFLRTTAHLLGLAAGALVLTACSALQPSKMEAPAFYALETPATPTPTPTATATIATPAAPLAGATTLLVHAPRAAAGFDSQRIIYVREPHRLEYYAHSEWIDPPAQMLGPLLVAAATRSGAFRAVVLAPAAASGEMQLDTQILRLQQEFGTRPSQVRFTLRATLSDDRTRRLIATRDFEATAPAPSETPYGGVVAANQAVQAVLEQLAGFCAQAARQAR